MPTITSPLRYPGGKSGLSLFLAQVLEANGLQGCCFIEPFGGGAGAALNLLSAGVVKKIIINDIDPTITSFWKAILYSTDSFIEKIQDTDATISEWKKQKTIYSQPNDHPTLDVAFASFFLNRTNRSGVLAANPIGGINQLGKWKIDARYNKKNLIQRILHVASLRNRITVLQEDAITLLQKIENFTETTFVYLDPPYYNKGSELYLNYYTHNDHELLANFITQQDAYPWLATYDNTEEIKWLYRHCNIDEYSLNYHVTQWKIGKELCITPHSIDQTQHPITFGYSKNILKHLNQ